MFWDALTCHIDSGKFNAIEGQGSEAPGAAEAEGRQDAGDQVHVSIVRRVEDILKGGFELVLIREPVTVDGGLDLIQACDQVRWRLLICGWRLLNVLQGALELQGIVPLLDEA